ncbi:hypothetical protein CGRA01v4_10386 [Colletotrichum graminicola]|nr:hypothetical protein CGRA01v4_10386 [Colletotrichum graminicola]
MRIRTLLSAPLIKPCHWGLRTHLSRRLLLIRGLGSMSFFGYVRLYHCRPPSPRKLFSSILQKVGEPRRWLFCSLFPFFPPL